MSQTLLLSSSSLNSHSLHSTLSFNCDINSLAMQLRSLYSNSKTIDHHQVYYECACITLAIAEISLKSKKKKIDIRDVIVNNLILAWNIRHVLVMLLQNQMLFYFIKVIGHYSRSEFNLSKLVVSLKEFYQSIFFFI